MIETEIRKFFPDFDPTLINSIRRLPVAAVREAILWEYGLTALLPFAIDPAIIELDARDFMKLRGTLASIRMALKWVGFPEILFTRLSSFEYELDPGRVPGSAELVAILAALSASVQARGKLKRIYHGTFEVKYA